MKKLLLLPLLFIAVISFGQVPNYVPTDSLVGYWGFNGNANDESGNGNDGTVNGATLTTDRFGNGNAAYSYDGITNEIVIAHNSTFDFIDFSISAWALIDNQPIYNPGVISKCETNNNGWYLAINSNDLDSVFFNGAISPGDYFKAQSAPMNVNQWVHYVCTFSPGEQKIYANGILINTDNNSGLLSNTAENIRIGHKNGDNYWGGKIDDIGIWNRALTECEIQDLYDGSLGNCCALNPITSQPTNQSTSIGNNATFSFTDNLTGAAYQWQMNAGTGYSDLSNAGQFSGTDTQILTISSTSMSNNNTLYRCIVTESASCSDTTDVSTLTVIDNTAITELNNSLVKLFPNPSNGNITLDIAQHANGQIILTDILGKEVLNKSFTSNKLQINLKNLASKGTYFAKIIDLDGNIIAIKKLIYQ